MTKTNDGETATRTPTRTLGPNRMVVVVPREQLARYEPLVKEFAAIPGCRVIVDRRVGERRSVQDGRRSGERRSGERRSSHLDQSQVLVVIVR